MEYFEFYNPVKLLCGESALENIPYELAILGSKRPLVLISRTMMEDGILEQIGGCDGVMAIGGGSVLDTAKAVRVLLSQNKTMLRDLLGSEWLTRAERVPFLMVPTTSGTGSECTGVAVIQDDKNGWKQEIVSDQFLPDVAVLDPRSTEKLPANLTAACGMDALTHAVEAYSGIQRNPLSNAYAYSAVELIGKNLIAAVREPKNQNYRMAIGSVCGVSHGEAVGFMLPRVMRWQMDQAGAEYGELLCAFCGAEYYAETPYLQRGEKLVEAIEDTLLHLHQKCGIPTTLKQAGVDRKQLSKIVNIAVNDGALLANRKPVRKEDIFSILQNAM